MPAITDRSAAEPLLKFQRIGHGTLECVDIVKTRRFYEEVLGFEVAQLSARSLVVRLNTHHTYAVVETGKVENTPTMNLLNHNGLDVASPEAVQQAYETIMTIKDEWGLLRVQEPRHSHGDMSFYFLDFDGNWWEIVAVREGGYSADFEDLEMDMTGRHELDGIAGNVNVLHMHEPEFRKQVLSGTVEVDT